MNYIALAVPFFFVLIVVEVVVARLQGQAYYRFNDAVTDLSCGIGQQVTGVLLKSALLVGYVVCYEQFSLVKLEDSSPLPWIIAFFWIDFAYYWWHRLSHEVAFMWAVHVVHHQSEEYNLAVALRQAWFSGVTSWVFYLPMAFVGVSPLVFVASNAFNTLYQFWIHTRTIGKLGPLEWVMNTPSHHRVHHGRNPRYLDKNYAAILIVWDRLFGTFEEETEEPLYGTIAPYESWNPVWANFAFWRDLTAKARRVPRLADKARVWFAGPGWVPPGSPAEAHEAAEEPPVRFDTPVSAPVKAYVVVQFIPIVALTTALMVGESSLAERLGLALFVLVTTVIWGGLFEGKRWALPLEVGRLGVVVAAVAVYTAARA